MSRVDDTEGRLTFESNIQRKLKRVARSEARRACESPVSFAKLPSPIAIALNVPHGIAPNCIGAYTACSISHSFASLFRATCNRRLIVPIGALNAWLIWFKL